MVQSASSRRPNIPAMTAIGIIHTPFLQSQGTPIQSSIAGSTEGTIEVYPEFAQGLRDVAGFERLWLIYYFDRAARSQLIVRPYLDSEERGVFATRSPARPNHRGLSAVRLLRLEGNRLTVAGVDMLDGTPLVDIKPYIPDFDHFEATRTGWYDGKSAQGVSADTRFEASDISTDS
jgi:tRNA-Thr(GGU) m(6)t(6)A37 methyltransferase TsaA